VELCFMYSIVEINARTCGQNMCVQRCVRGQEWEEVGGIQRRDGVGRVHTTQVKGGGWAWAQGGVVARVVDRTREEMACRWWGGAVRRSQLVGRCVHWGGMWNRNRARIVVVVVAGGR